MSTLRYLSLGVLGLYRLSFQSIPYYSLRSLEHRGCGVSNASTSSTPKSITMKVDFILRFQTENYPLTLRADMMLVSVCETTQTCVSIVDAPASPSLPEARPSPLQLLGLFRDTTIARTSYQKQKNGSCWARVFCLGLSP
jgi:hypothetical protein